MVFLAIIKWKNNDIFLIDQSDGLTDSIHQDFFCNELGAEFDGKNTYIFKNPEPELFEGLQDYLGFIGVIPTYDDKAQEQIKIIEGEKADFEKFKKIAIKIKNQPQSKLKIPFIKKALKSYQIPAVIHATSLDASANFSVPGSGKTWMAYATYFIEKSRKNVNKLLIVGPNSSFKPWENEYLEMTGESGDIQRITGTQNERRKILGSSDFFEIFLVNYFIVAKELQPLLQMLSENKFMLIVDESHHFKNPNSIAADALLQLSKLAKKRMILSGTPVPNNFDDLWSQFTFLYPNYQVFGDFVNYQFSLSTYADSPVEQLEFVKDQIDPFYTRISKKQLGLPPVKIHRIPVPMSEIQKRVYNAIRGHIKSGEHVDRGDEIAAQKWRKASMIYLIECATDPSLLTKSSQYLERPIAEEGLSIQNTIDNYEKMEKTTKKIETACDLVGKIISKKDPQTKKNSKVIVWCSFVKSIRKLEEMLADYKPISIYGAIPKDEEDDPSDNREIRIESFKTEPDCNLLIANPASLAESVSLHKACHNAIYLDRTYNGGHYMQSLERIHRIGIPKGTKTEYYILQSEDTIDLNIDARLEDKKDMMLEILNDIDPTKLDYDLTYDQFTNEFDADFKSFKKHLDED